MGLDKYTPSGAGRSHPLAGLSRHGARGRVAAVGRLASCRRGTAAVEFALILPVFFAFLVGIIEFGRAMWTRQVMQFAVEEAARMSMAETTATQADIAQRAQDNLAGIDPASVTITATIEAAAVTVVASTDFQVLGGGMLPFGPITMTARARAPR